MTDTHCHRGSPLPSDASTLGITCGVATLAGISLFALYFAILTLLSGWEFATAQFEAFRFFIVALAAGFGIQAGLFAYLHRVVHATAGKVLVASGGTSGVAMLSCCTHYLVNLIPALGATGLMTLVSEYQIQLFWLGIAGNLAGIAFMLRRLIAFAQGAST